MAPLRLEPSGAFRRDLRRSVAKGADPERVQAVLALIQRNDRPSLSELARRHRMRLLEPRSKGVWECHVDNTGDLSMTWRTDGATAFLLHVGGHDHVLGR